MAVRAIRGLCGIVVLERTTPVSFKYSSRTQRLANLPIALLVFVYDLFCSVLCLLCLSARLFISALWSPAGKGLPSLLSLVVYNCEFAT